MDLYAFASLAHIRILLIPVGSIQRSVFEQCAAEIRTFDDIRLGDIPADDKDEKARFMPSPLSTGHLHLSFPSHPPPLTHAPLSLLKPSHFPLAVVGVAACSQTDSLSSIFEQFNTLVNEAFPSDSLFPFAKRCFVFEDGDGATNLNLGETLQGLVVIPSLMGNKKLYIGTLLADLCSQILGEFGVVAKTLESPVGNEYLNSAVLPILPPLSDMPKPLDNPNKHDSLPPLPPRNKQQELGALGSSPGKQPMVKRNTSSSSVYRQASVGVSGPKKRLAGIGVASSHGRLFKVLGDFFLLAGRVEDALVWYTESMALLKLPQDSIWYASALEGMATCHVLDAWSAGQGLQTPANTREPWSDVSDKLNQAIAIYFKSPSAVEAEQHTHLLAYLYICAVLRQSSLLWCTWSAKGWGPLAFTAMLQSGPTPYLPPTLSHGQRYSWLYLERMSSVSGISRSSIAAVLSQAHGPWLLHLGPVERIAALEFMAGMYSCLGYRRKEAYMLREVLGCILDLLVCGREEDDYSRRSSIPTTSALGIQGLSSGIAHSDIRGNVGVRQNESTEGNDSILQLLKYICQVLGINLDAVRLVEEDSIGDAVDANHESLVSDGRHADDAFEAIQDTYGWPELQVGVVREAVAVAEALPDFPAVAQFASSALKTLHTVLLRQDQHHLYVTSARALRTARRRGDNKHVEFWSGNPILNITITPLPFVRLPIERRVSAITASFPDIAPILTGAKDPFLYNPRRAMTAQGRPLVVQNESLEFVVTLRNPYVFDLEIQNLALSTSGVPLESKPVAVVIPSNSFHPITIVGKALETGTLVIRGCIVRSPGGVSREFVLQLSTESEEDRQSKWRSTMYCEVGRTKYSGLDSRPWERTSRRASTQTNNTVQKGPLRFLECEVVPEQPLLRIRRTSVTHGAVMLYNGEMSVIRVTLENVAGLPVDFLRLAFDDSTISPAQQALNDGGLSVFDTYETEYDLIHRPMFSWNSPKEFKTLEPGQKVTLTISCFGKSGCTSGTILVSYGYVHRPQPPIEKPLETFHARQLSYSVMVTVYDMLECHGMDILPFPCSGIPHNYDNNVQNTTTARRAILHVAEETGWCLFSIEVRNTYGLPFEVIFERLHNETPQSSTSCTVPPGSTTRIVLPIKKLLLPEDVVSKAIPTLSDRQFVLTKSNLTSEEAKTQRELFWYREELFKSVRGRWQEAGGTRCGDLSLRQQRLTLPMLSTLRTEAAGVQMSLVWYNNGDEGRTQQPVPQKGGKYLPPPNEFVYLRIKVTNLSLASLVFTVDVGMDPGEHVVSEGVLADIPVGCLGSGEKADVEIALCFLSFGRFDIRADVQIPGTPSDNGKAGTGQLGAIVAMDE